MGRFLYVYILQSELAPNRFYVGRTEDVRTRLAQHNARHIAHTTKWKPWRIKSYFALSNKQRALDLERYLKSASGRAFAKKRL